MPRAAPRQGSWGGVALAVAIIGLASPPLAPARAQTLPADAKRTCTVPKATFARWFASGVPEPGGAVNPADSIRLNSVGFPEQPNCNFYRWAEQMFLWLTSPASAHGGGSITLDSQTFFDVSPLDKGTRTLQPHTPGFLHTFGVRTTKPGPHGLPVIFNGTGQMLEIERPQGGINAHLRIRDAQGDLVDVAHAERSQSGTLVLRDLTGAVIAARRAPLGSPILGAPSAGSILVRQFVVDGVPIFIDPFDNVVELPPGQADGGVLRARNGSLVYYGISVNDVYVCFRARLKKVEPNKLDPTFPYTDEDLAAIASFATENGRTLSDATALAVEVKTSWVEAARLPNSARGYIKADALVPDYNMSASDDWPPSGRPPRKTTLALVGMHVVGSAAGHPEMIWATFEHFGNTPDAAYDYINVAGARATAPPSMNESWLFSRHSPARPGPDGFNKKHMKMSEGAHIKAIAPYPISPSDTIRWKPWGAASDLVPNPNVDTVAESNTELIAINKSVHRKMRGDVRSNYFLVGATWTEPGIDGGQAPVQPTPQMPRGNQVGTSLLANSTMETYQQGKDRTASGTFNCFSCHVSSHQSVATTNLSHIFDAIATEPNRCAGQ